MTTINELRKQDGIHVDLRQRADLLGVEVEIEAKRRIPIEEYGGFDWVFKNDDSLRNYSIEAVSTALPQQKAIKAVRELRDWLNEWNVQILESVRTAVHVHVGVGSLTMHEVMKFVVAYYLLEKDLTEWCGKNRVGNAYCFRITDAEGCTKELMQCLILDRLPYDSHQKQHRYAGLNFASLVKFGTLEFRSLQTLPQLEKVEDWINILVTLKESALKYKTIFEMIQGFSQEGPEQLARNLLGDYYGHVYPNHPPHQLDLIKGMRIGQELAHAKTLLTGNYGEPF